MNEYDAVLERLSDVGGAAVCERVFAGVDANLSKCSCLVSLFPPARRTLLGLRTELRPRAIGSHPPAGAGFDALRARLAARVAPTLLEQPLSVELERAFDDRVERVAAAPWSGIPGHNAARAVLGRHR
jgi:hypothetical protein